MSDEGKLKYEVVLDIEDLKKKIDESEGKFLEMGKTAKKSGEAIKAAWQAMGGPLITTIGTATLFGKTFAKVAKDTINSTQKLGDAWQAETAGWKSAYDSFTRSLASGEGWSTMLKNMTDAYEVGKKVAQILDEIFERQNSLNIVESEYAIEIAQLNQTMRDSSKTDDERIAAAERIIEINKIIAAQRVDIAQQQEDAYKDKLQQATKMTDAELEFFVAQYNANRDVIQQAQTYNAEMEQANKSLDRWKSLYHMADEEVTESMAEDNIAAITAQIEKLNTATSESIKQVADLAARYDLSNDELILNYVNARAAKNNAQAQGIQSSTRANTTKASIIEQTKAEAKQRQDAADELARLQKEAAQKVSEAEIKGMVEGHAKKLREIEVEKQATLLAIDKEQEEIEKKAKKADQKVSADTYAALNARRASANDAAALQISEIEKENAKYISGLYRDLADVFVSEEQRKVDAIHRTYEEQREQLAKDLDGGTISQGQHDELSAKTKAAEEKMVRDSWIETYGSYEQKLAALRQKWADEIKNVPAEFAEEANKQMAAAISDFIINNSETKTAITRLFDDMTEKSVSDLRIIAAEAQTLYDFLSGGTWDDSVGEKLGISKEQFDTLRRSPDELDKIRKAIREINEQADDADTIFHQMSKGLKEVFAAGSNSVKLQRGMDLIASSVGKATAVIGVLQDALQNIAEGSGNESVQGIADGLGAAMDAVGSAMNGAQAGATFGPWGAAAGAAIGLVSSLYKNISKLHDENVQKRIKGLQDQIDGLSKSYDTLSDKIDAAFGSNKARLIEEQSRNLQRQNQLIRQQIAEENNKKNTDEEAIKGYQDQIKENQKLIEQNKAAALDAIFGSDISSAISDFADAVGSAWAEGNKGAEGAKEFVKSMMKQMVSEAAKAYVQASGSMDKIREAMRLAMLDDIVTDEERRRIEGMAEQLAQEIENKYGWAGGLYGDSERKAVTGSGITASQDSVDETNARLTTMQSHTYSLMMGQQELNAVASQILAKVTAIESHTSRSAEILDAVRSGVASMRGTLDDIALKGVRLKD